MNQVINILLIEDEEFDVRRVKNTLALRKDAFNLVDVVSDGGDAIDVLNSNLGNIDLVIMDYQIAGSLRGEELIRKIRLIEPTIQVVVITKHTINIDDFEFANKLLEAGAFWYCTKYPGDIEEYIYQPTDFILSLFNAYEKRVLQKKSEKSSEKIKKNVDDILRSKPIIGSSDFTKNLLKQINKLAASDINVMIQGASGTGKELIANNIHYRSNRRYENFVPINCGSIPAELIESELFGFEKGSFTGATGSKKGLFELANHGTIFLDEIAELPLNAQVKLLRVLQEGEIEKIGRTEKIKVDVRVIAATNKNLEEQVREGNFRQDLYFRLNVVPLRVKPLKERKDDIIDLINYYLDVYSSDMNVEKPEFEKDAIDFLLHYDWPGNVRELKNLLQRLLFYAETKITKEIVEGSLIGKALSKEKSGSFAEIFESGNIIPLKDMEKRFRKEYFEFVRNNSASDAEAAQKMGLAPPNYHRMCKELGLK